MPQAFTAESLLLDDIFLEYHLNPTRQNTQRWEKMVRENNIHEKVIAEAKAMLDILTPAIEPHEIEEEVIKLQNVLYEREMKRKRLLRRTGVFVGMAAILCGLIFFTRGTNDGIIDEPIVSEYRTGIGEQKKIVLPDGTIVILNSGTTLTYHKKYNQTDRRVYLSGQAFFKVAKNPSKPFSVINGQFSTTVLGTSFYINGDSSKDFSVRLLEGKVKVSSEKTKQSEYLEPGQEITAPKHQARFIKQRYDTAYLNKWASGKIVFRKTPVSEALTILQQWYGVEIIDARKERSDISINGTYENVSLEDILKVISFSLDIRYRHKGNKVIIE
jgi:ferric-dicitrate binding protein FerR (iron transport regulator)